MTRAFLLAATMSLSFAVPVLAQDAPPPPPPAATTTGSMTAADVGVSPISGLTAPDYATHAADSDRFEIESARTALLRSQRSDVKSFAQTMIDQHTASTQSLMAALKNDQRTIKTPPMRLSAENASLLKALKKAPKANFDTTYLTQQLESHKKAWALQKGYATSGEDVPLRQVAANTVPVVEQHITMVKGLIPAGVSAQ